MKFINIHLLSTKLALVRDDLNNYICLLYSLKGCDIFHFLKIYRFITE